MTAKGGGGGWGGWGGGEGEEAEEKGSRTAVKYSPLLEPRTSGAVHGFTSEAER